MSNRARCTRIRFPTWIAPVPSTLRVATFLARRPFPALEARVSLLRFLGISELGKQARERGDTASVRRIAAQLERLEPETAKRLASFAYVLARVANADLEDRRGRDRRDGAQRAFARRALGERGGAGGADREDAVERAGGHRELHRHARVPPDRRRASSARSCLQCLYAVAAADGTISGDERSVIGAIAEELGFTRAEANALRAEYRDKLSELRELLSGSAPDEQQACADRARRAARSGRGCRGP